MIYVFHGEDSFSSAEALRAMVDAVGPPELRDSNYAVLEAGEFTVDRLGAAAMVMPFLADRRLAVVRGLMGAAETQRRGRRGAAARPPGVPAGLEELLRQVPPTTDVVFVEGKIAPGNPTLAAVKEVGEDAVVVREFPALRREALAGWAAERAASKGASIDGRAASLLAEMVGPNLWVMDSELEKLSLYCEGRPIGADDVQALVSGVKETTVFRLVDAIMARRTNVALAEMRTLLDTGSSGPYLLAMVARQARMIAIAHELDAQRAPRQEWGARLGNSNDFVIRKTQEQARRISPDAVRGLYGLLVEADLAMKSSVGEELALTEMLTRASALPAARR